MIPLSEPVLGGRELEYVTRCLTTGWISTNGEFVQDMEEVLASYLGVKHVVACNSGTSAIHISLLLSGVQPDDEVIVPTVTFIAPVNAVRYLHAWPVFVDCDEYWNMDVEGVRTFLAEECIVRDGVLTNRTTGRRVSAIVPVHVFGTSADMDPILALAAEYGLAVVEDASESLGSRYRGRMCGHLAPISCLSFNGNKIVTTGGGGAIVTDDDEIAAPGPLPHDPGQGGRRRVRPQQRWLQLSDEQRPCGDRLGAAREPRRAASRSSAPTSRVTRRRSAPPACSTSLPGASRTAGSTPSCATTPT